MARDLTMIEAQTLLIAERVLLDWARDQEPNAPGVFAAEEAANQIRSLLTMRAGGITLE